MLNITCLSRLRNHPPQSTAEKSRQARMRGEPRTTGALDCEELSFYSPLPTCGCMLLLPVADVMSISHKGGMGVNEGVTIRPLAYWG